MTGSIYGPDPGDAADEHYYFAVREDLRREMDLFLSYPRDSGRNKLEFLSEILSPGFKVTPAQPEQSAGKTLRRLWHFLRDAARRRRPPTRDDLPQRPAPPERPAPAGMLQAEADTGERHRERPQASGKDGTA